jgi:hypothetical protein
MAFQTMRCTICHIIEQVQSSNNTTCEHKAIVAKYVLHCKSEDEAFGSSHEKSKKSKQDTTSTITDLFRTFNLTKFLIPFR